MEKVRVYQINQSKDGIDLIKRYINNQSHLRLLSSVQTEEEAFEEIPKLFPDIVIVDENVTTNLSGFIQSLVLRSPYIGIIVTTSSYNANKVRKLMNVGARDILVKPFRSDDLAQSVIAVHNHNEKLKETIVNQSGRILTKAPKMITVFSTKGGVGKSVIATLLAAGMSSYLKEDTAVVDLDLQFGDVSLLLDIKPKNTITTAVEQVEELTTQQLRGLLTKHSLGMSILPSPLYPEEEEFITEHALTKILGHLKEEFNYVIVDCPPGFTKQTIVALEQSDLIIFVTSAEISSLKNTKNGLNTFNQLDISMDKVKVLINRYSSKNSIPSKTIEEVLGRSIYATIPEDYESVIEFLNLGDPDVIYGSKRKLSKALKKILEDLRSFHIVGADKKRKWDFIKKIFRK